MQHLSGLLTLSSKISWVAQLSDPGIDTSEEAALIFSGPQFFIALLSGLVLAFGFQMLLTNLSVAAGVSYLGRSSSSSSSNGESGSPIKTISIAFGAWTLITVSLALFFACWLAIKLSLYNSPTLGAITGLVIWGTYFSLLFWISSTTVGSLIGSVVKSATNGFQALVGTATAALGAKSASNQIVQTAEEVAAAVRRELTSGIDTNVLQDRLEDYLGALRPQTLDMTAIEQEFDRLMRDSDLAQIAQGQDLSHIDRQTFVDLVSDRTNLSEREARQVADRLYRNWQRNTQRDSMAELVDYLKTARPEQMLSRDLGDRLDQLIEELRQRRPQDSSDSSSNSIKAKVGDTVSTLMNQSFSTLVGMVMGRTDLSDLDINSIVSQIRSAQGQVMGQAEGAAAQLTGDSEPNTIKADTEAYLRNTYVWRTRPDQLESEFRNVIYDAEANTTELRRQLEGINRAFFREVLQSRGVLTQDEIRDVSLQLETVRQQVLRDVITAEQIAAEKELRRQTEIFLQLTPKEELFTQMGEDAMRAIAEDDTADAEQLRQRFRQIDGGFMQQFLSTRPDISPEEAAQLAQKYQAVLERVIADSDSLQASAQTRVNQQWQAVQDYLRRTGKPELSPEGIQRDIKALMDEPSEGISRIRARLAQFDRDTLVQLLSQRPEFSEAEAQRTVDDVESSWYGTLQTPQRLTAQAQIKYDEATGAIAEYLRSTGKPELSPEGIQRDLQKLIDNPKAGARAIRFRLARMDRDTLVKLLSQRDDLSEAEVNRAIDDIQASIQKVLRTPRRLAQRTQAQVMSFEAALENYLRNTDKAALSPEGIKRDLQVMLDDPQLGASRLADRAKQIDRDTVVALLAQRNDMSEAEAQQVVDQVLSVRDRAVAQIQLVQRRLEAAIDSIFARLRRYLNSLDRPELSYEGIERDVRKLFDDPQAGFEALRYRLSRFDRDTLMALVTSTGAVSEADVHRVVGRVELARDSVLRRAERLETQVQTRINDIKLQTQKQVEDTRKAAEAASWWLFGTALISAIVAAVGGMLAVGG